MKSNTKSMDRVFVLTSENLVRSRNVSVLPHLIWRFNVSPVKKSHEVTCNTDKLILKFIWGGGKSEQPTQHKSRRTNLENTTQLKDLWWECSNGKRQTGQQNREPRNSSTQVQPTNVWQRSKGNTMKESLLTNGMKQVDTHMQNTNWRAALVAQW